jgi:hypothetical protein
MVRVNFAVKTVIQATIEKAAYAMMDSIKIIMVYANLALKTANQILITLDVYVIKIGMEINAI